MTRLLVAEFVIQRRTEYGLPAGDDPFPNWKFNKLTKALDFLECFPGNYVIINTETGELVDYGS